METEGSFWPVSLAWSPRGWRGSGDSFVLVQQLQVVSGGSWVRVQFGRGHRTAALALGMPSPIEFNPEWGQYSHNLPIGCTITSRGVVGLPEQTPSSVLLIPLLFLL